MTNPKTTESRAVAGRAKPATPAPAPDGPRPAEPSNGSQDVVLEQLVALTQSIKDLVRQNTEPAEPPQTDSGDPAQRARVVFAYDFLGSVLGRRAPRVFQLRRVEVTRDGGGLTFNDLRDATAAKIRSDRNVVVDLNNLRDGVEERIDGNADPSKNITNDQRIDSIILFNSPGGVPVAIGPCLGPDNGD